MVGNSCLSVKQSGGSEQSPQLIGEELLIPTIAGVRLQFWSAPLSNYDDRDHEDDHYDDGDSGDDEKMKYSYDKNITNKFENI